MDLALVIMAAGMGSRFGGLKQMEPVGPKGELLVEYAIYDAIQAGFNKLVFIIKEEMEETFLEKVGHRVEKAIDTTYVFQQGHLPQDVNLPADRTKPWGTAHAVLCCKEAVDCPFAVINADDYYGRKTFQILADFLRNIPVTAEKPEYCMAAFRLANTLTDNGYVSRGICSVDDSGLLSGVDEHTHIEWHKGKILSTRQENGSVVEFPEDTPVSMNAWGLTPDFFDAIESSFPLFINKNAARLDKAEFYLPSVVDEMIQANSAVVSALPCPEKWYGITYKEDLPTLRDALSNYIHEGLYPSPLWQ